MRTLLAWFACAFALACSSDREVIVIFRYDDYSAKSDTALELALLEVFRRHNYPFVFGVVPTIALDTHRPTPETSEFLRPLLDDKFAILREAMSDGTVEVALHGLTHQRVDTETRSEFKGRTYEDQLDRISRGKSFLEEGLDTKIRVFIPPWNSFDASTIRALETLELDILSSDITRIDREVGTLTHLPKLAALENIREVVEMMHEAPEGLPPVVVVMHAYDFGSEKEWNLSKLEGILNWMTEVGYVRGKHFADAIP